ncbi:DUF485 domain-containing protein [Streptomyces sp. A244]|uniref:DUF485 domain-containing protein n=1 Tax=Streptomyces sp. A244 TaxID=2137016 RepID=UPI000D1BC091|nr:DUF485 domain-containing protein [Streptomyces sp. A244]PTH86824.1 DUF485 domain-containing protein [Streptomyces sp. A244]
MSYDPSPSYPYRPPDPPPSPSYDSYTYDTYPWAPQETPEPAGRRPQRHAALGHHSDLRVLRSAYRWQRRVATLTALGYFVLFLILSAFAPSFMTSTVTDGLPTGLLLALVQVPVTWLAVALYEQTARRRVDPIADRIRKHAELDAKREGSR